MAINDRISKLIDHFELNPNSFADSLGVKGTVIYNIVKGRRSKPSFDLLQKILVTYHTVNANWLLSGSGSMSKREREPVSVVKLPSHTKIEQRFNTLLNSITSEMESPESMELQELFSILITENAQQKEKIAGLYKKQDEILDVIRKKLNLDF